MRFFSQIGGWVKNNSEKILLSSVFCSALALAFISGVFYARDQKPSSQLIVNIPDYKKVPAENQKKVQTTLEENRGEPISSTQNQESGLGVKMDTEKCVYKGSKNSDKYHLASCGVVKRIKPENIRCFESVEVAEAAGYKPGCLK